MKRILAATLSVAALGAPALALAYDIQNQDLPNVINYITDSVLNPVIRLIFALALIAFLYGVYKYVISSDVKSKADGRTFMIYGIIGLAVMLSVWGIATFVKNAFFSGVVAPPTTQSPGGGSGNTFGPAGR